MKRHEFFEDLVFEDLHQMELPHKHKLKLNIFFKENNNSRKKTNKGKEEKENLEVEVKIIKEGLVKKKSPWFYYNKRKIILYNSHKIEYIDPSNHCVRGVIFLSSECKSILIDNNRFDLITPNRTFIFKVSCVKTRLKIMKQLYGTRL